MTSKKSTKIERYIVDVPEEIGDKEQRMNVAFLMAEEEATTYYMPCNWYIEKIDGDSITVIHEHY